MDEAIIKYDERGNCIYYEYYMGLKIWWEHDENNNMIYTKDSEDLKEVWQEFDKNNNLIYYKEDDLESWRGYDENNNEIHSKNSYGFENWYKYNENNEQIEITQQEFKQIERNKAKQKLYLNNKRINRFEIMDI